MMFFRRKAAGSGIFADREKARKDKGPKIASMIILTIFGFLLANVVLAAKTSIPELTRAAGEIIPQGHFLQVESTQSGIVATVLVQEGQEIEAGQILTILSSPEIDQGLQDIEQEIATGAAKIVGFDAVVTAISNAVESGSVEQNGTATENVAFSNARIRLFFAQQEVQSGVVESLRRNVTVLEEAAKIVATRATSRAARIKELEELFEKRLVTVREYEERRDKFDELQAAQLTAKLKLADARKELRLAEAALAENRLSLEEEYIEKLFDLNQNQLALTLKQTALQAQAERLKIRSPAAGVLHSISFPSPGEVIELGETLFEILPRAEDLVAEIRIGANDIGHIKMGATVSLKLDTYDPRRYGKITGHVASISPKILIDTVTGEEYFRATVILDSDTIGRGKWQRDLRAGMSTSAEIVTSERTVMAYLLKPIQRSFESAFGER